MATPTFLALFGLLHWAHRNRIRLGGGGGYALDPVCGMQVESAHAPASAEHEGEQFFFFSDRCRLRFEADSGRFAVRTRDDQVQRGTIRVCPPGFDLARDQRSPNRRKLGRPCSAPGSGPHLVLLIAT
jgi:YHS domain-containing protein